VFEAVLRAFRLPDVRRKLIFTFAMLAVFRVIAHVPLPGVRLEELRELMASNQLLGMLDLFSGGSLTTFSIAALGVYPYITAQIVMQVLSPVIPQLQDLQKEGESGRMKVSQYTRLLAVPLAILQAYAQGSLLAREGILNNFGLVGVGTFLPTISMILTLTATTMFLVWLGELITEQGIGNGMSLIIFAGIISKLPASIAQSFASGIGALSVVGLGLIGVAMVGAIIYINEGQRRIMVQYAKRIRGNRVFGGTSTYIPLRVNSSGMIPLIFAMSIMLIPGTVATYFTAAEPGAVRTVAEFVAEIFSSNGVVYWVLYFWLVVGFTYFYTAVVFQQQNLPETLQKQGGFIPGIRAGRPTADYLNRVLNRITLLGAVFLGVVAVAPYIAGLIVGDSGMTTLSSTGILIVVGVVLDTMKQLEAQLMMRQYEGFIR
jgi:preprotein translocase subunit SecY